MIFSDPYFPCFLSCLDWTVHWISFLLFPFITSVLCFVPQMRLRLCLITLALIFFPSSFAAEAQRISLTAVCHLIASFQLRSKSHRKHFTSIKQTLSASRYFCDTFSSKFSLLLCKTLTYCHEVLNILVFVALYVMKVMSQCKLGFLFFFFVFWILGCSPVSIWLISVIFCLFWCSSALWTTLFMIHSESTDCLLLNTGLKSVWRENRI